MHLSSSLSRVAITGCEPGFLSLWWPTMKTFGSQTLTLCTQKLQTTTPLVSSRRTLSRRGRPAQKGVWPRRETTDLLYVTPLISAGRELRRTSDLPALSFFSLTSAFQGFVNLEDCSTRPNEVLPCVTTFGQDRTGRYLRQLVIWGELKISKLLKWCQHFLRV